MRRQFWVNLRTRRYQIGLGRIMSGVDRPHVQRHDFGTCLRVIGRWGVIVLRWPGDNR